MNNPYNLEISDEVYKKLIDRGLTCPIVYSFSQRATMTDKHLDLAIGPFVGALEVLDHTQEILSKYTEKYGAI